MKTSSTKREEIIAQAFQVFYQHGFHATGVDKLLEDSGISKRTMYKYFRSKEELIAATICFYRHTAFEKVKEELLAKKISAKEKILALFDMKYEALKNGNFNGCFAINATLEYEGKNNLIEGECHNFMTDLEQFVTELCKEAQCKNYKHIATQILLLFEGTIVYGQASKNPEVARVARDTAKMLLDGK